MSNRQLPEPAEISSLRLAGHWMRHTLTGWLAAEVVPVLAGCRLPDRGMEALHGASRLWAADLEVTIGVPNHTYAESIRISTLPYFQSAYMCMQHNKWSKIKVFGNCPNLWVLETVWPETVSQLGRTAAWTGCKTCIVLQPKFLFYVWKSGNRPDANNTKDNAMIGLIGCSVIVLQSQRSPHRTYILGKTLGCLHEIEATTPGKTYTNAKVDCSLRCMWQQQRLFVRDCRSKIHWLLDMFYHFMPKMRKKLRIAKGKGYVKILHMFVPQHQRIGTQATVLPPVIRLWPHG